MLVPSPADLGREGIAKRVQRIESESYFESLGLPEGATAEAVRASYVRLAKLWHPDRLPRDLESARADVMKIFTHMTRARETLCDPTARRGYLETHALKTAVQPRTEVVRAIEQALAKQEWDRAIQVSNVLADAELHDAEAIALRAWAAARGGEASSDVLRVAVTKLDRAVNTDNGCERAFFYRGKLAKRLGNDKLAFRDFSRVVSLNPSNAEALREVRVFEMRARKQG
jgi:curved DNA-binding protein CbpA